MGWKGDGYGLGKDEQGIAKPVDVDMSMNRFGLGFVYHDGYEQEIARLDQQIDSIDSIASLNLNEIKSSKAPPFSSSRNQPINLRKQRGINMRDLINNIHRVLANFIGAQNSENDLMFDKSLTTDDRKLVHKEAHKLGLKTRSEGSGGNRFLVVSKKRSANEIIESTIQAGQFSKYQLISKGDL